MAEVDQRIYGVDIALTSDGDITFNNGDLVTVGGLGNLGQAIKNRIFTERGSLGYNSDYGLNINGLIGEKLTGRRIAFISMSLNDSFLQDPRVEKIETLNVQQDYKNLTAIRCYALLRPIGAINPMGVNFVYPFYNAQPVENVVTNETQYSTDPITFQTEYEIARLTGVYLATDVNKTSDLSKNAIIVGRTVTLATNLNRAGVQLIIDYTTFSTIKDNKITKLIENEIVVTRANTVVYTTYPIYDVVGVWLSYDSDKAGINYFLGGSFIYNGRQILLGTPLPMVNGTNFEVLIEYWQLVETRAVPEATQ